MSLEDAKEGKILRILKFNAGQNAVSRMNAHGIYEGSEIKIIKNAPFRGPVMIENVKTGGRIMIGRGIARKIEVDLE